MTRSNGIDLNQYKTQAKEFLKLLHASETDALERLSKLRPKNDIAQSPETLKLADAQRVIARENGFPSWPKFSEYLLFQNAVKAIDSGDIQKLTSLLDRSPALIRYRCSVGEWYERGYFAGATLLNHVAGNPIRCPLPQNILEVARLLLSRGARGEPPKTKDTIGLLLTSRQASEANVALPLVELIVEANSLTLDFTRPDILDLPLLNAAPNTAEELLRRGARMDIRHAAALGRLELVKRIVNLDASAERDPVIIPLPESAIAAKAMMEEAFIWSCRSGQTRSAEYLLELGVDANAQANVGQPGLHSAVGSAHIETVRMLIARKVPLEEKNQYGGTPLGQAVWSGINEPLPAHLAIIEALLEAGSNPDFTSYPTGNERIDDLLKRFNAKT